MTEESRWVLIPAAGSGRRMGGKLPKQYLPLAALPVLQHTLNIFARHAQIDGLVLITAPGDERWRELDVVWERPFVHVIGGDQRWQSVWNGLQAIADRITALDWVLVHDAVRPCLRSTDLDALIGNVGNDPVGGLLATPVSDTIKQAVDGRSVETKNRVNLWHAQTPQMFRLKVLWDGLEKAVRENLPITDEAGAVEALGLAPLLVSGRRDNIKITHPEDIALAEFFIQQWQR